MQLSDGYPNVVKLAQPDRENQHPLQLYFVSALLTQALPSFPSLAVQKSGRGPGIIYHVSGKKGGESVVKLN